MVCSIFKMYACKNANLKKELRLKYNGGYLTERRLINIKTEIPRKRQMCGKTGERGVKKKDIELYTK